MATGIVSIAARLQGLGAVAAGLFGLDLATFAALWAVLAVRLLRAPAATAMELVANCAPGSFTVVAATCVLGNEIALVAGNGAVVDAFCIAAIGAWLGLSYGFVAWLTVRPDKESIAAAPDGSWLLLVVATQGAAILVTRASPAIASPAAAALAGLVLFLLGGAFYAVLLGLIVYRWLFLPLPPEALTPPYWINMGAGAITTLAGARLLTDDAGQLLLAPLHAPLLLATLLSWAVATWWLPLLAGLTIWRHRRGVPIAYGLDNWAMVFPLGMYTTATWRLSHAAGLTLLRPVSDVFLWVALAAWALTFAGMVRAAATGRGRVRDAGRAVRR